MDHITELLTLYVIGDVVRHRLPPRIHEPRQVVIDRCVQPILKCVTTDAPHECTRWGQRQSVPSTPSARGVLVIGRSANEMEYINVTSDVSAVRVSRRLGSVGAYWLLMTAIKEMRE